MTNLTEEWKKGELKDGFYYVQMPNGTFEILSDYALYKYSLAKDRDEIVILAHVPNYEELQALKSKRDKLAYDLGVADTKNGELLRLLKEWVEAYPVVAVTCDLKNFAKIKELLDKTNEVLK